MHDLKNMDPRELGRGLMRGDSRELKQGYSWENALKAVLEVRGIEPQTQEAHELGCYLDGFAKGMAHTGYSEPLQGAVLDGIRDGAKEPRSTILPAEAASLDVRQDITPAEADAFSAGNAGEPLAASAGVLEQAAWARGRDARDTELQLHRPARDAAAMAELEDALDAFKLAANRLGRVWLDPDLPAAAGEAIADYPPTWHAYEETALEIAAMRVRPLAELEAPPQGGDSDAS